MKKLRVFHGLVNYGTQAGFFAKELRKQGIEALSACYHDNYKRQIDVQLLHKGNIIQKALKYTWNGIRKLYWFYKFNVFHFYYGTTLFRKQRDLPFYKLFGKKIIMHYLGGDVVIYNSKYTHYGYNAELVNRKVIKRLKKETPYTNLQVVCMPYYAPFVKNAMVIPLAIDLNLFDFKRKHIEDHVVIAHAPTNKRFKGTEFIVEAIEKMQKEGWKIRFDLIVDVKHDELRKRYSMCDIFIDQIIAGWYGTAAIEAMAVGRTVVAHIDPKYFNYIDFADEIPIVNANKDSIYFVLKELVCNRHMLPELGEKSRKFVEKHHDVTKLTAKLIKIYETL
ncbi:MAG: glycosyltransferase [Acidobacteriota bacterium]|nr:glycosyltransferase [Acidobacteriota bacterium]